MNPHLQRAELLIQQSRSEQAEEQLHRFLAESPNSGYGHALLGLCYYQQEKLKEAAAEAREAIHLEPDNSYPLFVLSAVLTSQKRYADALATIDQAIAIDPFTASYHAQRASILSSQKKWNESLQAAEMGLQVDPDDVNCLNMRAMALTYLGRKEDAIDSIDASLSHDPDNANTHANKGWTCLHQGDAKKALEHFREALRLDPESEWAKAGIVESLKASNFLYRWILRYFLWMSGLSAGVQWGIIIGAYFGSRVIRNIAIKYPQIAPIAWTLYGLYVLFALFTWIANPLFNLMLRLHPVGKHALSRDQRVMSNWMLGCILLAVGLLLVYALTDSALALLTGLLSVGMTLPITMIYICDRGWPRIAMTLYALAIPAFFLLIPFLHILFDADVSSLGLILVISIVGSTWVGNILGQVTVRR